MCVRIASKDSDLVVLEWDPGVCTFNPEGVMTVVPETEILVWGWTVGTMSFSPSCPLMLRTLPDRRLVFNRCGPGEWLPQMAVCSGTGEKWSPGAGQGGGECPCLTPLLKISSSVPCVELCLTCNFRQLFFFSF